jgi:hypothetical protein
MVSCLNYACKPTFLVCLVTLNYKILRYALCKVLSEEECEKLSVSKVTVILDTLSDFSNNVYTTQLNATAAPYFEI